MAETKKTKRVYFGELREIVVDNPELVAFIDHELSLLDKKANGGKDSAKKQENREIIENFITELAKIDTRVTISEFQEKSEYVKSKGFTNQKVNALFKIMKDNGQIVRTEEKGKAYFELVQED